MPAEGTSAQMLQRRPRDGDHRRPPRHGTRAGHEDAGAVADGQMSPRNMCRHRRGELLGLIRSAHPACQPASRISHRHEHGDSARRPRSVKKVDWRARDLSLGLRRFQQEAAAQRIGREIQAEPWRDRSDLTQGDDDQMERSWAANMRHSRRRRLIQPEAGPTLKASTGTLGDRLPRSAPPPTDVPPRVASAESDQSPRCTACTSGPRQRPASPIRPATSDRRGAAFHGLSADPAATLRRRGAHASRGLDDRRSVLGEPRGGVRVAAVSPEQVAGTQVFIRKPCGRTRW
jgi:hypothetical protein